LKILVTGGAGFIGSNFLNYMVPKYQQHLFVNLDALTYAGNLENLKSIEAAGNYVFVKGSINDQPLMNKIFVDHQIDRVVHFAAESHVDRSITGPAVFVETNVLGTQVLLDSARQHWLEAKKLKNHRFLHVSTDEVFGSLGATGYFSETTPYAPNSPYSASKASSDMLVRAYHHTFGLDICITNCSNNYGPYQFPEKLIPLMIANAIDRKDLPIYGDGKNVRDWLYVLDHCKAIEKVLFEGRSGETYCIGGNNEQQNIQIIDLLCEMIDEKLGRSGEQVTERLKKYVTDRKGHDKRYAIDATKIKRELGWEPETNFAEGIRKTVDWYMGNQDWVNRLRDGVYQEYYEKQYGLVGKRVSGQTSE